MIFRYKWAEGNFPSITNISTKKSDIKLSLSKKPGTLAAPYHSSTVTLNCKTFWLAAFLTITEIGFCPKLVTSKRSLTVNALNVFWLAPTLVKKSLVEGKKNLSLL